jgi:2'-5' RNA ligase
MFIAVDLPRALATEVGALCDGLPGARWSNPEQLHLTLRFFAAVPEDRVAGLRADLARVARPPFPLGLRGVGVFPPRRRPARVLWAGIAPLEGITGLKTAIDAVLGPDPEAADRGFSPHLTLARFRDDPGASLNRYLTERAAFVTAPWTVEAFRLYRSTIGASGAVHEVVEEYPLRG